MIISLPKFSREFLFLLIATYFAQGSLYALESVIAKISLLLIIIISFFYLIKSLKLKSRKGVFYYALIAFLLLNFVGYLLQGVFGDGFSGIYFSQLKKIIVSLLVFFPFYYFSYKGYLSKEQLLRFFIIMMPIVIFSFYLTKSNILSERLSDDENVVNNSAYLFVSFIPYVFLWSKRKLFSIISLSLLLFFIIQSGKRGAVIIGIMSTIFFAYYQLTTLEPKKRLQGFIVSIIGVLLLISFSYEFYLSNEYLINRLSKIDEGGSGRDVIYSNLFNNWAESNNVFNYLLGFGFVSTVKYSGTNNLAHNDWLEVLTNFGLLGMFIYLTLFFASIFFIFNPNVEREDKFIMVSIIIIWFLKTLFSMFYTSISTVFIIVLLGFLFGKYKRNQDLKQPNINIQASKP